MNALKEIIRLLSNDEQKDFIQFLKNRNKRIDIKNVELFKALVKEKKTEEIVKSLYQTESRNAYHGLRKRLYDNLIDFVSNRYMNDHSSEEIEVIQYIIIARYYLEQSKNNIALKLLKKGEQKAKENDAYPLLNEIYFLQIQYAHETKENNLTQLITNYENNKRQVERAEKLNVVYAVIRQRLEIEGIKDLNEVINQVFKKFQIEIEELLTFRSLYQLMVLLNMAAAKTRDYYSVTPFMKQLYELVLNKNGTREKSLFYHIEVLYLMANLHFRNKDFSKSLFYLGKMKTQMEEEKRRFFKRFELKHECLRGLNYHYLGKLNKAIQICEQIKHQKGNLLDVLDINQSLVVYYFSKKEYKKANQCLNQFIHNDSYYEKRVGLEWIVKKVLVEILVYIENEKPDLAISKIASFQRKFKNKLEIIGENRIISFVELVKNYVNYPEKVREQDFKDKVNQTFEFKSIEKEDILVLSFFLWLKSKMIGKDFYELLIDTLKRENYEY